MKKFMLTIMVVCCCSIMGFGQMSIPDVNITNLEGEQVRYADIFNQKGHTILFFWSFEDEVSLQMINDLNEAWDSSREAGEYVKVVGICINSGTRTDMVKPYIFGNDIQFANYIDENGSLKRALNISSAPFIMLIDKGQELVYMHSGYCPGIPEHMCDKIVNYKNNSAINSGKFTMAGN